MQKLEKFLSGLRKQDVISPSLLSRHSSVTIEQAEEILPELVNAGILTYFIIVACKNPDIDDVQAAHYQTFNSLKEFAQFSTMKPCPVCGYCGSEYDSANAKIGYKRS